LVLGARKYITGHDIAKVKDKIKDRRRKNAPENRAEADGNYRFLPIEGIRKYDQHGKADFDPEVSPAPGESDRPAEEGKKDRTPNHSGTAL
jgi:hypothetical protein